MGKKQMCPYCKEKVDLKRMFSNPYPFHSLVFTYEFYLFFCLFVLRYFTVCFALNTGLILVMSD